LRLPPGNVVGLLIDAHQLVMIRTHRERSWKLDTGNYGDADHVERELAWAKKLYQRQGWKYLDVTDQAIEETAARILELLKINSEPTAGDSFSDME
jgi:regulator of PEP synthase PpsR (kinase-PPPase family)